MLDGLKRKFAATAITSLLKSLAGNKDTQTTITGIIAGAVLAIPGLDWAAVVAGDPQQVARLVAGLLVALIGFWATKAKRDGHTTMLGTLAGGLYASQGTIESITTGLVVAALGHLTNKPTTPPVGIEAAKSRQ